MSSSKLFVEGGGDASLDGRCKEGFRKLLEGAGLSGRMPRIVACGTRREAYDDFAAAHQSGQLAYAALLVDSEKPVTDPDQTWAHLADRDGWVRPGGATDERVLFMTTCMETWIVADRKMLIERHGASLRQSALLPTQRLEARSRDVVQSALEKATQRCTAPYSKGRRSFELLGAVDPQRIRAQLPSLDRALRILDERL